MRLIACRDTKSGRIQDWNPVAEPTFRALILPSCPLIRYKLCSALLKSLPLLTSLPVFLADEVIHVFTLEIIPLPQINQSSTIFSRPVALDPSYLAVQLSISFKKTEIRVLFAKVTQTFAWPKNSRNVKTKPRPVTRPRSENSLFKKLHALWFWIRSSCFAEERVTQPSLPRLVILYSRESAHGCFITLLRK